MVELYETMHWHTALAMLGLLVGIATCIICALERRFDPHYREYKRAQKAKRKLFIANREAFRARNELTRVSRAMTLARKDQA